MFCPHCGNQLGDQVTFCPYCGQRIAPEPTPDASAQPAAAQPAQGQGASYADPAATAAYPGATAQYPAQAAYQQQAGQGAEGTAQQQPADAAQAQGARRRPSAVTIALAVAAIVLAVVAVALVFVVGLSGFIGQDEGDEATEAQSATASGLIALFEAEVDEVYATDDCSYLSVSVNGEDYSDQWWLYIIIEEDGTLSDVDIYVYWPIDGDVEEGFAHAEEVVAYVFDLLADGGYLDDWDAVPDATFSDEFVAEVVDFAAGRTTTGSTSSQTETDEGYYLMFWFDYELDYDYVCMNYEIWR